MSSPLPGPEECQAKGSGDHHDLLAHRNPWDEGQFGGKAAGVKAGDLLALWLRVEGLGFRGVQGSGAIGPRLNLRIVLDGVPCYCQGGPNKHVTKHECHPESYPPGN